MNLGIKNKLKELIGKDVEISNGYGGVSIIYNPNRIYHFKVLRFENEDCVVIGDKEETWFVSIDHISNITIKK